MRPRLIAKFGGTSLADKKAWEAVLGILRQRQSQVPLVVVSAVGSAPGRAKVTDLLQAVAEAAIAGSPWDLKPLKTLHSGLLKDLELEKDLLDSLWTGLEEHLKLAKDLPRAEALDRIMGWGERLSARMMAAALRKEGWEAHDATPEELGLVSDDVFQNASIKEDALEGLAKKVIASKYHLVVPGYVAVTQDGRPTTLGRGGSDYTAAVFGAALKRDVEIWTDVDGVAITNPTFFDKRMRGAGHPKTIPQLSHEEAYQMAAFGSRVLFQKCMSAAKIATRKGKHLRLIVKNTFNPDHPGTILVGHSSPDAKPKGITALEGVQLLTVYLDDEEDYRGLLEQVDRIPSARLLMASYSTGRASFVFDRLTPEVEKLEVTYAEAHLSKDQVLIKVVGDGMGANHWVLSRIHQAVDQVDDKDGVPLLHKSPQLLTDSTFECVALKRGAQRIIMQLYKDLFQEEVNIGMLGMGTVGGGVIYYADELYSREKTGFDLAFPVAAVRDLKRAREGFTGRLTDQPAEVLDDPRVDIVVELMGGLEPARTLILEALAKGKHVITANKAVLATHGAEIFAAAAKHRRNIGFEAAVCGEIPVIEVVRKMPSDQDVEAMTGIMNGTSNYLLTHMAAGLDYEVALKGAQEAGFAEADPFMDVSGTDAAQKLSILASLVFHTPVPWQQIHLQGIDRVRAVDTAEAARLGSAIRPCAHARRHPDGLELWVGPAMVSHSHSLYSVQRETNAVSLELRGRPEPFTLVGKGAGALPTARSVLRDILEVARKARYRMIDNPAFHEAAALPILDSGRHRYGWWVRCTVKDVPGVFAQVASSLGNRGLSIQHVNQTEDKEGTAHIMLAVKPAPRQVLDGALTELRGTDSVLECLALPVL